MKPNPLKPDYDQQPPFALVYCEKHPQHHPVAAKDLDEAAELACHPERFCADCEVERVHDRT